MTTSAAATCDELGIGFVAWGPLGQGFLTGTIDATTSFAAGDVSVTDGGDFEATPPQRTLLHLVSSSIQGPRL